MQSSSDLRLEESENVNMTHIELSKRSVSKSKENDVLNSGSKISLTESENSVSNSEEENEETDDHI